jgi:phosphotransferase system  glucose/maltose/N-acetylglucosamine-specific IIC component
MLWHELTTSIIMPVIAAVLAAGIISVIGCASGRLCTGVSSEAEEDWEDDTSVIVGRFRRIVDVISFRTVVRR